MPDPDLPPVERLQAVDIGPDDHLVATVPADADPGQIERLRDALAERWPDNDITVVSSDIELSVYRPGETQ